MWEWEGVRGEGGKGGGSRVEMFCTQGFWW